MRYLAEYSIFDNLPATSLADELELLLATVLSATAAHFIYRHRYTTTFVAEQHAAVLQRGRAQPRSGWQLLYTIRYAVRFDGAVYRTRVYTTYIVRSETVADNVIADVVEQLHYVVIKPTLSAVVDVIVDVNAVIDLLQQLLNEANVIIEQHLP